MHRQSDYAGLETVSTHKSEIKTLTLSSCFCEGHLVVNWALVMQVMRCTHYREALQKSTALQQSSSSRGFAASKRAEQKPALQTAVKWTLAVFLNWQYLPSALAYIHVNFCQPFSKIIHSITLKSCTSTEAKILPGFIRSTASRKGRDRDLLLGWPWHTWCLVKRGDCPN